MEIARAEKELIELTQLGDYQNLNVQSNTLLLADVLTTFEICVLKDLSFILFIFFLHQDQYGKQP